MTKKEESTPVQAPPNLNDAAREGARAVDALISQREKAVADYSALLRHYDQRGAKIESLEHQLANSEAQLDYHRNLSTSLTVQLSSIKMLVDDVGGIVEDAILKARDAAIRGETLKRPNGLSAPLEAVDQAALEAIAQKLAPEPMPPMRTQTND